MSTQAPLHLLCVVAARPNLMKMAPILAALERQAPSLRITLLHTGQHYDPAMSGLVFTALGMRAPDISLDVGSASHAQQTAEIMRRYEPVHLALQPKLDAVMVVGDVNSTLACALVAAKLGTPVIHVEAGLRSGDRSMPEEINRLLTDQLSELLFSSETGARANLLREGIAPERIHFVGNVMIDSLRQQLPRAASPSATLLDYGHACPPAYGLLTLHRPSNVDDGGRLGALLLAMAELSRELPLLFPIHPRTLAMLRKTGLEALFEQHAIVPLPPLGYLEMLGLMQGARLVLTDSGGIQEETTALGVPCLTLRDNTERPVTVDEGTNTVAGTVPATILALARGILQSDGKRGGKRGRIPEYWDGHAAERIAAISLQWLRLRRGAR
ncbi:MULTISPECIES: non-hydrolyzing UDP-N-acetylglucosamine 2-epimerase [unclassified Janthinobacterium]|uniref:non-hydrolyzing UDP-N-acetylglucosamine 2-epimerase n=1 Tax=unclassified Janthinobacterium TaxID=2610881 RepID=UPI0016179780|nr:MULTISPECIES: UDP-N-acetylglucosamine 2-epimerase (non-hydrolyzing) [unclassified Janthinobacterium]MBB5606503.1 UDP-N-acetylglucosamine 2-epimerase (non-hydrolyzing) [Janthinobacterium sp. S3T4]MBB5611625.1 UDP-N-acetylglucosamine 2-epimerase (non-hydrolyzing) [Janthinobacterium sp. S3M3]